MKRSIFLLLMIAVAYFGYGQPVPVDELNAWRNYIQQQRSKPVRNVDLGALKEKSIYWWDGNNMYLLMSADDEAQELLLYDVWADSFLNTVELKGKTGYLKDSDKSFSLHQMGETMLLVLYQTGKIYNILTQVTNEQPIWSFIDLHDALDGLYVSADGTQYVFGIPEMFEGVDSYTYDPGMFSPSREEQKFPSDWDYIIEYGEGRVSRGDYVEDPAKRNMPGAGGAGALMGPMIWGLNQTDAGLEGKVLHDEPNVDHYPQITENFSLTKIQTPFKGIDGIWAFASVRPLNREMLVCYPKDVLRLMRNEIYARHGVKFSSDAMIQAYFDKQSWYKPSANPSQLTGLEMLNVTLIKSVEEEK